MPMGDHAYCWRPRRRDPARSRQLVWSGEKAVDSEGVKFQAGGVMRVRQIDAQQVVEAVREAFMRASYNIGVDVLDALKERQKTEKSELGREILKKIVENDEIAASEQVAMCQDTGLAVLFVELGQDAHVSGGDFQGAIEEGVRQAYTQGYLRKSCVADPLFDRKKIGRASCRERV